jgi:hypothetical protein
MNAIEDMVAGVAKTIGGNTNGATIEVLVDGSKVGDATVDTEAGTWSYSLTVEDAGEVDVKSQDGTDPDGYALQEGVVVASAVTVIDDFESYSNLQNLNGVGGWANSGLTTFRASTSAKYEGSLGCEINKSTSGAAACTKTLAAAIDTTGKTIKFYGRAPSSGYVVTVKLYNGASLVHTASSLPLGNASWLLCSLTYNGSWDKIRFDVAAYYDFFIDYITVE